MQSGTTGINTLRIYNPDKQAIEQDPHGVFIRRWLPELSGVPDTHIHQPWTMPAGVQQAASCLIGRDYPEPIVDHTLALRAAKARFSALRHDPAARAEARDVADRHGSRRDRRGAMQQDPVRRELAGERRPRRSRKPVADGQRTFSFLADDTED
jgi:deoxyribodipyrimidine photo-lyase